MKHSDFFKHCQDALGADNVVSDAEGMAPYLTDWRKRYVGSALAVMFPNDVKEVTALVSLCAQHNISIVPQGGNTGLCGGATPVHAGQIVLNTKRLNRIRQIDPVNNTLTVEAGCTLKQVQDVAQIANRFFPLSMGSEGSCTLGGNLACNAGGTAVLRYGNTRDLCLGLEVVTVDGEVLNSLRGLRKDNTGYDLKNLFIGSEGTLGIITAATIKIFPQPKFRITALAQVVSIDKAIELLTLARSLAEPILTGFELISDVCMSLVKKHFPAFEISQGQESSYTCLIEFSDYENETHAQALMMELLESAYTRGLIDTALIAQNIQQSRAFWQIRESIPLAEAQEGISVKHDIALPLSNLALFVNTTQSLINQHFPEAQLVIFGHLGDGNLHYNVQFPKNISHEVFLKNEAAINHLVYDNVYQHGGSLSAEHGLGQLKNSMITRYKSPVEISMMKKIKQIFDPSGRMNPGKVLVDF